MNRKKKTYIYFYFLIIVPGLIIGLAGMTIEFIGATIEVLGKIIQKPFWNLKKHLEAISMETES